MAQFGRCLLLPLLAIAMLKAAGAVETPMQRFAPLDTNHYQKCVFPLKYSKIMHFSAQHSECYDAEGQPQRCVPDFINAAFTRRVEASPREFTCGVRRPNTWTFLERNSHQMPLTGSVCRRELAMVWCVRRENGVQSVMHEFRSVKTLPIRNGQRISCLLLNIKLSNCSFIPKKSCLECCITLKILFKVAATLHNCFDDLLLVKVHLLGLASFHRILASS